MMVRAESPVQKSLACDIAAILEEKDPLTDDTSADYACASACSGRRGDSTDSADGRA
mgnify:CR=1 FL=1